MTSPLAVVMGVAGCGKTTVGTALAERLGVGFADADAFHPAANVAKMHRGEELTDADREPWLRAIAAWLDERRDVGTVVTCSALKRRYRDLLRAHEPDLPFLHLAGPIQVAYERVSGREGHFMPASLVDEQYAELEPLAADERGLTLDFTRPVAELVEECAAYLA